MVGGTCFVVVGIVRNCKKEIDTMETIMVELSPEISLHALRTDTTLVMISQSINQSISPSLTHSIFATVLNLPWVWDMTFSA
jgi:hypothetical protein